MPAIVQMLLVYGALFLLIALLVREFWCWYWKINRIIELLEYIAAEKQAPPREAVQR